MTRKFGPKTTADEVLAGVDLRKKRILITGVSSGIGLETARALAARGAPIDDAPGFIDGVASYALDAKTAARLWTKSAEMVNAALARLPQRTM